MPIDKKLDTYGVPQPLDQFIKALVLRSIRRSLALVGLRARVCGSAERVRIPSKRPIAIDVSAVACAVAGTGLAVFAPEAFDLLAVHKAIRVHKGDNIEVVGIEEGFGFCIVCFKAGYKLCCDVFDGLEL